MEQQEILSIIIIPIVLALLPPLWGFTSFLFRRNQFRNLILREIQEIGPHPPNKLNGISWTAHHSKKRFVHKEIFGKPTENRDFILSLPPDLVYYTTQLWQSKDNANQWLYMIQKIKSQVPLWIFWKRKDIQKVWDSWHNLMKEYGIKLEIDTKEENVIMKYSGIDCGLTVNGESWRKIEDFSSTESDDKVYLAKINDDGSTTIVFGDGERGRIPPTKAMITAIYRYGGGSLGKLNPPHKKIVALIKHKLRF